MRRGMYARGGWLAWVLVAVAIVAAIGRLVEGWLSRSPFGPERQGVFRTERRKRHVWRRAGGAGGSRVRSRAERIRLLRQRVRSGGRCSLVH